jgi:O-succinylbenzoate synthase
MRVELPLVRPFQTARGSETVRSFLLLRWRGPEADGWAECAADPMPIYFPETLESAWRTIESILLPIVADNGAGTSAARARHAMSDVPGNELAKAVLETAILDSQLRSHGLRMVDYLGGRDEPISVGVSVGIARDVQELLDWVAGYLADGYERIKLKIQPGWDVEPVRAVRETFGSSLDLQVDANQAYRPGDEVRLAQLDEFGLLLIEQPFGRRELLAHARLAQRLRTPICLDESITSLADAAAAVTLGACGVINIKPARVGGYLEARAIHDLCQAQGIPVFCGGVLESGVGRAANLALAALPNFTLRGDISATSRYFSQDITQRFELREGKLDIPTGPGSGAEIDLDALRAMTVHSQEISI